MCAAFTLLHFMVSCDKKRLPTFVDYEIHLDWKMGIRLKREREKESKRGDLICINLFHLIQKPYHGNGEMLKIQRSHVIRASQAPEHSILISLDTEVDECWYTEGKETETKHFVRKMLTLMTPGARIVFIFQMIKAVKRQINQIIQISQNRIKVKCSMPLLFSFSLK